MRRVPFLLSLLSAAVLGAGDGVILRQANEDLLNNTRTAVTSYVETNRVAVSSSGEKGSNAVIFLADSNVMRMIDHSNKTVREMSGDDLEGMMAKVNEAMLKMQEQLKNVPAEQRKMVEQMMGAVGGPGAEKIVFKRGSGSTEIGGHACDWYDGYRGETLQATVCAAEWSNLNLRVSDFVVFQKMASFLTKLAPGMADLSRMGGEDWQEQQLFPGVPVEQTIYMGGKPLMRSRMEGFDRGPIDEAVFATPEGYKVEKGLPVGL